MSLTQPTEQEIQNLKDFFECEYCHECSGDWYDHDIVMLQGHYFGEGLPFYRCKISTNPNYKVREQE